ncbi:unnamed protein product, partial [Prorocentrum cordatum]
MKDKGVQIFMASIAASSTKNLKVFRGCASEPWETNYERIMGSTALINNESEYAQKPLVKFCPRQESFDNIQKFALNLVSKYQSAHYGVEDMHIGLTLFGIGEH